jgi:hypothetical protein
MHTPTPRTLALRTISVTYPGTSEQIRVVRADVRVLLGDCPMADDMILCVSELATHVLIEVEDNPAPWTPAIPETIGHGLDIVRALASDWGIDGDDTARTTWARFDWPGCE